MKTRLPRWWMLAVISLVVGFGHIGLVEAQEEAENGTVEVVAEYLEIPWDIAKYEQTFYLTQRTGSIVRIEDGEQLEQTVQLDKELSTASEAGLLGFALAPNFAETQEAFAYYTYGDETGQFNRIVVLRLEQDVWQEERVLVDLIPSGSVHHGGRLAIGPDEKLYATTGDAALPELAQDLTSLAGKILRLNLDGSIPTDNPFADSYVYSYGHRNPQGLSWAENGNLYASEHGQNAHDEINLIEAGANYGWPLIEGMETETNMTAPLFTSGTDTTWAPSGLVYEEGKLYVATLRGSALLEFDLAAESYRELTSGLGRIRDVWIDSEAGALYFITNNTDGRGQPMPEDDKFYRLMLTD